MKCLKNHPVDCSRRLAPRRGCAPGSAWGRVTSVFTAAILGAMPGGIGAWGQACPKEASPYGINAHAPEGQSVSRLLDEVCACGIDWIRVDFVWAWIETAQDSFNWARYDTITSAARARGLTIFATIGHTPAWATDGSEGSGVPRSAADYYDVCYRAALRYQDSVRHWGMWNEPNLDGFWAGTRQQYIDMILKNGADAVHAVNPAAKACGPELAHLTSGDQDWYAWLADCITQAGSKLDIVTHHVYCSSGYASCTDKLEKAPFWPWDPPSVKQVLQNAGWFGKPFWLTEIGWQSDSVGEAQQAASYTGFLTDWFTGKSGRGWVHKVFFYELNDTQAFPDLSWGILGPDPTYARKPSFTAYQSFITAHPAPAPLPGQAYDPEPADLAAGVSLTPQLRWTAGDCAESHSIHFGLTNPPPFVGNRTTTNFAPGTLSPQTIYYWRVDEVNSAGTTTGTVWRFQTGAAPGDFDSDGDVDQEDFGHFQACFSGPAQPFTPGCGNADIDDDGDVDQTDFGLFESCMAGPDLPPTCS